MQKNYEKLIRKLLFSSVIFEFLKSVKLALSTAITKQ